MNKLNSDTVEFVWNEHCRKAFNELKLRLCSKPVLVFPRVGEKFIVDGDASEQAFGDVLMQEDDAPGSLFFGHYTQITTELVNYHEGNICILYLACNNFIFISDHNPLVCLRKQKDRRGKFGRWVLELEESDSTVKYVPGIKNVKADALSRSRRV